MVSKSRGAARSCSSGFALLGVAALATATACGRSSTPPSVTDVQAPAPATARVGEGFRVGILWYQVDRVQASRRIGRGTSERVAPQGSVFVLAEFQRTWRGSNSLTVPGAPLEFVASDGSRTAADLDASSAHLLATNCGDLGPARLDPNAPQRSCEVFVVPEAQLRSARLQPSAAAHRNLARPEVILGELAVVER